MVSAISILPDVSRRCPAVDHDNHRLFVSLGCSAENLVQAAHANGLSAQLRFGEVAVGEIIVVFEAPQTFCLTLVSDHTGNRRPDLIVCFGRGRSWGALRHVCTS